MGTRTVKQAIVLGIFLVFAGILLLLQTFVDLSAWLWFVLLAVGGLAALVLYLADRSDLAMLITAYVLLAIAGLVGLIMLHVVRDEGVAVYVLAAVALPFLAVYGRDRRQWWALVPAYVLLALALMIGLMGLGVLGERLVPAYVMFAIAIPFYAVYAWDRGHWWALIPAGVMTAVGLFLLVAEAALPWLVPMLLILAGVWLLVRMFANRRLSDGEEGALPERPEHGGPESDVQERAKEE
jgi:hypothetical protein